MGLSPARLAAVALAGLIAGLFFYEKSQPKAPPALEEPDTGPAGPAPAAVHSLGGNPLGEAPKPAPAHTNESLYADLERQKKSMGIQKIVPPEEKEEAPASRLDMLQRSDRAISRMARSMGATPSAQAKIEGTTPKIVAFTAPFQGAVAASDEQARSAWTEAGLDGPPPAVDFTKALLVVAPGPIAEIKESAGFIVIRYRKSGPPAARYGVMEKTTLPMAFEPLP